MEILLSSTMLGAVAISLGTIYGVANHHMIQEANSFLTQNDASFAMEHMKRHLMVATHLADPATVGLFDGKNQPVDDYPVDPKDAKPHTAAINFFADPDGSGPLKRRWQRYEVSGRQLRYYPVWPVSKPNDPASFEPICREVNSPTPFHRPLASEVQIVLETQRGGKNSHWRSTLETTVHLRAVAVNEP